MFKQKIDKACLGNDDVVLCSLVLPERIRTQKSLTYTVEVLYSYLLVHNLLLSL